MKLKENNLYQTRDGRRCYISCIEDSVFGCIGLINGEDETRRFRLDGAWHGKEEHRHDLISEWPSTPVKSPVIYDRSLLPAWANKAIAMGDRGRWYCYSTPPKLGEGVWDATQGHCALIPREHSPQWSGDWKDSLLVFEDQ